jgi:hypothetical protein
MGLNIAGPSSTSLSATYVSVADSTGAPVTNRHTRIVLDEFGEIDDIVSEAI